jgi:hypothetical protein
MLYMEIRELARCIELLYWNTWIHIKTCLLKNAALNPRGTRICFMESYSICRYLKYIISTDSLHSITSSDIRYSSQNDYTDLYKRETNISQLLTTFPPFSK